MDRAGNKGYATAVVTWIMKKTSKPEENEIETKPNNKPETSKKPSHSNTSNTTKPNNPNTEENQKEFANGNISIKIPDSILSNYDDISLEYKKHELNEAQINRYGKESEIFEISLETKENKKINVSDEMIEQTIELNPNKTFEAIYVIREDGSVVKLDSKVTENKIVFTSKGLGKYIVSYKSSSSNNDLNNDKKEEMKQNENTNEKKSKPILLIIVTSLVVFIGGTISFVFRKKK